ncbi:MAG: hypothetical protein JWM48_197 [Mycobacterium sp.]|nr:hypothetical protein [Mycobacterium sp.]
MTPAVTPGKPKRYAAGRARALGLATRGTTNPNRLRRADRWLLAAGERLLRDAAAPLVVDLGYGATPVTTVELFTRLRAVRADVEVLGLELDPARVTAATPAARPGLAFARGGFELGPLPRPATAVRAFNVLRQYDEPAVGPAWAQLLAGVAPGGWVVEGTCDELGRRGCWVRLVADAAGREVPALPDSITFAAAVASLERPSDLAERLPKALIHRNVPGEPVHALLTAWDAAWAGAAPLAVFSPRQRWAAAAAALRQDGWPVLDTAARWRFGELTLAWSAVAPAAGPLAA